MLDPEAIATTLNTALPGVVLEVVGNPAPGGQASLRLDPARAREAALFLRDDPGLRLDYASNATGVDWPDREVKESVTVKEVVEGQEKEVTKSVVNTIPGYLEAVYHLYSMEKKHGPLVVRLRTGDRKQDVRLPSLTPVWRSCEFQEREIYDLFGIVFDGHPDLRRILLWDGFQDHPMRKDYVAPDDFEWEPTPHDEVLERAKQHQAAVAPKAEEGGAA